MSAERDELRRLVDELPDDQVPWRSPTFARGSHPARQGPGRPRGSAPQWHDVATPPLARTSCSKTGSAAPRDRLRHRSLVAALANDNNHRRCVDLLTGLHLAGRPLLLPAPVTAEVGYLLAREDYARMADLVMEYADLPLGTTDAAVVAIAERLGVRDVATLDRRHFTVVRPRHVGALTLLP